MRQSFTLIHLLVVLAILALVVIALSLGPWLPNAIWCLLAGWVYFLGRKLPLIDASADAVVTGVLALLLLTTIVHLLMRRFYNRPANDEISARNWRFRSTAVLVGIVVLTFAAGISAVGITHQTIWMATATEPLTVRRWVSMAELAAKTNSVNNLKQMGLGIENFDEQHHSLPSGITVSANGRLMHGWQTHLLPFIEQGNLFQLIDFTKAWSDPANRSAFEIKIRTYRQPLMDESLDSSGYALSSYAGNMHVFDETPRRFEDFTRGRSNTILVGEVSTNFEPWGRPLNVRDPKLGFNNSPAGFGSLRKSEGTQFVMADGSVRTFRSGTDPEFLKLLAEPSK